MLNVSRGRMRTGEHTGRSTLRAQAIEPAKQKRPIVSAAWREARELVWGHRHRLAMGLALMLVSRLAGLVLPATSKWLIDEVVVKQRAELLAPIALAAGLATIVQAVTSF